MLTVVATLETLVPRAAQECRVLIGQRPPQGNRQSVIDVVLARVFDVELLVTIEAATVEALENLLMIMTWQDQAKAFSVTIGLGAILVTQLTASSAASGVGLGDISVSQVCFSFAEDDCSTLFDN